MGGDPGHRHLDAEEAVDKALAGHGWGDPSGRWGGSLARQEKKRQGGSWRDLGLDRPGPPHFPREGVRCLGVKQSPGPSSGPPVRTTPRTARSRSHAVIGAAADAVEHPSDVRNPSSNFFLENEEI